MRDAASYTESNSLVMVRKDVDMLNAQELKKLEGKEEHVYTAVDSGQSNYLTTAHQWCPVKKSLMLRTGAQVTDDFQYGLLCFSYVDRLFY